MDPDVAPAPRPVGWHWGTALYLSGGALFCVLAAVGTSLRHGHAVDDVARMSGAVTGRFLIAAILATLWTKFLVKHHRWSRVFFWAALVSFGFWRP